MDPRGLGPGPPGAHHLPHHHPRLIMESDEDGCPAHVGPPPYAAVRARRRAPGAQLGRRLHLTIDDATRLRRFLVLGVDGGTYYAAPRELARENAEVVTRLAQDDPETLVSTIVEVSEGCGTQAEPSAVRARGRGVVPGVLAAGTGGAAEGGADGHATVPVRGLRRAVPRLGPGLRRAVGGWYTSRDADALAYQVVKYRQREGWSHRWTLLRLAHPETTVPELHDVFDWIVRGWIGERTPALIERGTSAPRRRRPSTWSELLRGARTVVGDAPRRRAR